MTLFQETISAGALALGVLFVLVRGEPDARTSERRARERGRAELQRKIVESQEEEENEREREKLKLRRKNRRRMREAELMIDDGGDDDDDDGGGGVPKPKSILKNKTVRFGEEGDEEPQREVDGSRPSPRPKSPPVPQERSATTWESLKSDQDAVIKLFAGKSQPGKFLKMRANFDTSSEIEFKDPLVAYTPPDEKNLTETLPGYDKSWTQTLAEKNVEKEKVVVFDSKTPTTMVVPLGGKGKDVFGYFADSKINVDEKKKFLEKIYDTAVAKEKEWEGGVVIETDGTGIPWLHVRIVKPAGGSGAKGGGAVPRPRARDWSGAVGMGLVVASAVLGSLA